MKKKNYLFIAGLLLCAISFIGCDKNGDDNGKDNNETPKNSLSVSGAANSALSFEAKDNSDATLTVTTDASEWGYEVPGWVTAVKSGNTLVVNVNDNTGDERTGTIKFTAGTADAVNISVTQSAPDDDGDFSVTIDGDFSEWADYPVSIAGAAGLLEAKYYSDGTDLYIYYKTNADIVSTGWIAIQMFFDSDDNNTTGTNMAYAFASNDGARGFDNLSECVITTDGGVVNPIGKWSGDSAYEEAKDGWFAAMSGTSAITDDNIVNCIHGVGALSTEYYELEIRIIRSALPWTMSETFQIAARIGTGSSDNFVLPYRYSWTQQ